MIKMLYEDHVKFYYVNLTKIDGGTIYIKKYMATCQ
jgi:hypothetical protein